MLTTPGQAYWNQRDAIASSRDRLLALWKTIGCPRDLHAWQGAQLMAFVLEFEPDLILELGREYGNSTCFFAEAAERLGARVLSLCLSTGWRDESSRRIERIVPPSWLARVDAREADILRFDYARELAGAKRVAVFWDAHGFSIAECVLGGILPLIAGKPHVVMMHDVSDTRFAAPDDTSYRERGLWNGGSSGSRRYRIGNVDSAVAQGIAMLDFATRNELAFTSADESLSRIEKPDELRRVLGDELFSTQGHWFWFTLEGKKDVRFPRFVPPPPAHLGVLRRMRAAFNLLRGVSPSELFPELGA